MAAHWVWWVLGVVLVGAELLTGTFYLLAIGVAFVLGGVAAWLGAPVELQFVVAAVLSVAGTWAAHRWRLRKGPPPADVPLDVGQAVQVQIWHPDGTARVAHRGTQWDAELAHSGTARERTMYIVGTRGSTLLLAAERPA